MEFNFFPSSNSKNTSGPIVPHLNAPQNIIPVPVARFFVINTIWVKLLVIPSPYPVPGAALHPHLYTHLISSNKCLLIFNSEMSMALCKLETTLSIEFLEKRSVSGYSMIIAKVLESTFESSDAGIKLEVLNNGHDG